jgi:phosphoribosyl 1,2-cyclic phosphodiesterase
MVDLCAIASGSNGNCYYVGNQRDAILIDAGISARQILSRMKAQKLDAGRVKAIFITHEHSDHALGARVLSKRLQVPVFLTSRTFVGMYNNQKPVAPRFFVPGDQITIGNFHIHSFLKNHDAAEPCSFRLEYNGIHVGVFTDIGSPCENVMKQLRMCHALFLESNYDETMLKEGRYPWPLKQRILSDHGHLSNDQAFELLKHHSGDQLQVVFLSHLSAENNTPEKAIGRFHELQQKFRILLTSRYAPGEVIKLGQIEEQGTFSFESFPDTPVIHM